MVGAGDLAGKGLAGKLRQRELNRFALGDLLAVRLGNGDKDAHGRDTRDPEKG